MKSLQRLLLALILLAVALGGLAGTPLCAADGQDARRAAQRGGDELERVRQRWESLTPAERERMRERWQRYQALPEEERRELSERAQRVKSLRERVERQVPAPVLERVGRLPVEKREELLGELLENETARIGAHMRGLLPPEIVQRLEQARPEDRARYFAKFQRQQRERVTRYMIERLGARLALAKDEVSALQALPDEQRAAKVLELRQRLTREESRTLGVPPGLSSEQWNEWLALPPEEFFGRLAEHVRQRQVAGLESGIARSGARAELLPRMALERLRALRKLQALQRVEPSELLELSDLAPSERRASLAARVRQRCLAHLSETGLVPAADLASWRELPEAGFQQRVAGLVSELRARAESGTPRR